jgi:glycerol kinase
LSAEAPGFSISGFAIADGFFETTGDLCANWSADKTRRPRMPAKQRELMYQLWTKAVARTFGWLDT